MLHFRRYFLGGAEREAQHFCRFQIDKWIFSIIFLSISNRQMDILYYFFVDFKSTNGYSLLFFCLAAGGQMDILYYFILGRSRPNKYSPRHFHVYCF